MKISIIGFGDMGKIHSRIEKKLGYLSSIVEIDDNKRKNASELFNVPVYKNIEDMMLKETPNGIIIAVPSADHFSVVEEIIDLRTSSLKAIAIEKPVTSSLVDAYRLQRLLNEIGLKTLIGHSEIYNPAVQKLFEILSSQVIGIPKIFLFQRRSNVPNEKLPFLGDIFEDLAIHDFDLFSRIITKNELQIQCKGFYYDNILNSAIVQIHAIQNDISALFLFSRNFTGKIRQIEIEAINGTIFVELLDQYLIYNLRSQIKASMQSISISSGEGEKIKVYGEPLLEEHLDFHALLKEEKVTPLVSIKDAIRALSIVEACRKSAELDKSIKLNIESL